MFNLKDTKSYNIPNLHGRRISLTSAEEGIVSINDNIQVLYRLLQNSYSVRSSTDFFLITWNIEFENNTGFDRGIKISEDISVPGQNAVVVCEIQNDAKTNIEIDKFNAIDEEKFTFFGKIIALQNLNKIDSALRIMFKDIDQFALDKKFDLCNELFIDSKASQFNKDLQIGLLAITLSWKTLLPNRVFYLDIVRSTFSKIYSIEKTEKLLSGLI